MSGTGLSALRIFISLILSGGSWTQKKDKSLRFTLLLAVCRFEFYVVARFQSPVLDLNNSYGKLFFKEIEWADDNVTDMFLFYGEKMARSSLKL